MSTIDALLKELKRELITEIKISIIDELKPELDLLIKSAVQEIKTEDEFQPSEWFTKKYSISKRTFHKYKNLGYVETKQVGRFKIYNVKQWFANLNKIKSGKPDFIKATMNK